MNGARTMTERSFKTITEAVREGIESGVGKEKLKECGGGGESGIRGSTDTDQCRRESLWGRGQIFLLNPENRL